MGNQKDKKVGTEESKGKVYQVDFGIQRILELELRFPMADILARWRAMLSASVNLDPKAAQEHKQVGKVIWVQVSS